MDPMNHESISPSLAPTSPVAPDLVVPCLKVTEWPPVEKDTVSSETFLSPVSKSFISSIRNKFTVIATPSQNH